MKITLKDGSVKEYAQPMSILDIAKDLSEGLARAACAGVVDGETEDLRTVLDKDCSLNICTVSDPEGLAALRHTASHVTVSYTHLDVYKRQGHNGIPWKTDPGTADDKARSSDHTSPFPLRNLLQTCDL